MKKYLIVLLVFLFHSCDGPTKNSSNQHISPKYVILAQEIRYAIAQRLAQEFQMAPFGEGGSFYDCVRELFLAFHIQGPLTKDQLRNILVTCVKELLEEVNSNDELRPYLKVYPFTSQEISITLFVIDKKGAEIYDPNIGVASAEEGKLIYKTIDRNDGLKNQSKIIESYEDALEIVTARHQN
jgi:hypothetical protein